MCNFQFHKVNTLSVISHFKIKAGTSQQTSITYSKVQEIQSSHFCYDDFYRMQEGISMEMICVLGQHSAL